MASTRFLSRTAHRSSFTLVELLVVIAILSALMALLMPALKNARAASYGTQCANNIRQISAATFVYLSENNNNFFAAYDGLMYTNNDAEWEWRLQPTLGKPINSWAWSSFSPVYRCQTHQAGVLPPGTRLAGLLFGFNGSLSTYSYNTDLPLYGGNLGAVDSHSTKIIFLDGIPANNQPGIVVPSRGIQGYMVPPNAPYGNPPWTVMPWHNWKLNAGYLDGHVALIQTDQVTVSSLTPKY